MRIFIGLSLALFLVACSSEPLPVEKASTEYMIKKLKELDPSEDSFGGNLRYDVVQSCIMFAKTRAENEACPTKPDEELREFYAGIYKCRLLKDCR